MVKVLGEMKPFHLLSSLLKVYSKEKNVQKIPTKV